MGIENVKLGVCRVRYKGKDMGVTKGGVNVEVSTDTHKVTVDQFGESEINEIIMKRSVKVTAPLAETTMENLARVMPGATIIETGGANAVGGFDFAANPSEGETVALNGNVFVFKAAPEMAHEVLIGADLAESMENLEAAINASLKPGVQEVSALADDSSVAITYNLKLVKGNGYTLSSTGGNITTTPMSGGVDSKKRVEATNGVGADLLSLADLLTLHPVENADENVSEDFHVFKAATAGAVQFAYKLDEERVYNIEFTGYPDQANGNRLFAVGDLSA